MKIQYRIIIQYFTNLQESIQKASAALKQSIQLCNCYRRRSTLSESFGKMVKRPNYNQYTPGE